MEQKTTSIIVIVALVAFGAGYLFGTSAPQQARDANSGGFEEGWQAAKERLQETGYSFEREEAFRVEGEVQQVNDSKVTVEIEPLSPLMDRELDTRTLQITDNTEIYKLQEKSREEFKSQQEEYENRMQEIEGEEEMLADEEFPEPPRPYTREKVELSSLKEGQFIEAHSVNEKNIKTDKEFEVSEIIIEDSGEAGGPTQN